MTSGIHTQLLEVALLADAAGIASLPVRVDGSKAPAVQWKHYQKSRPTTDQIIKWFGRDEYDGLGLVTGTVSGNLEMLEFESIAVQDGTHDDYWKVAEDNGIGFLQERLSYLEQSPSGGLHYLYRVPAAANRGNTPLARYRDSNNLDAKGNATTRPLIETRGEGGFVVVAPSFGRTHASGKAWELISGNVSAIPSINEHERDMLWNIAGMFDRLPTVHNLQSSRLLTSTDNATKPGTDFNNRATWAEILEPHGWQRGFTTRDGRTHWTRPGKSFGTSATTLEDGPMFVFSTSTSLPSEQGMSKHYVHALLNHEGDLSAAARELRSQGYGSQIREQKQPESRLTSDPAVLQHEDQEQVSGKRRLTFTQASQIKIKPVRWAWKDRIPSGSIALLAGREGQGKSTICTWLIGQVTLGTLQGDNFGNPRPVIVSATEDSWESTIVPRLMAAGANLDLVYQVGVVTSLDTEGDLVLPKDIAALKELILEIDAAMLVLDPLMSRLSDTLDTHKDAETRRALEPLTSLADSTGIVIVGLMHFNKGASNDPLNAVMASKAFTAVARSVHTVVRDADDSSVRYFATPKSNLGRDDLPLKSFSIAGHCIESTDGPVWTSKIVWGEDSDQSIEEVMQRAFAGGDRTATQEASDWLADYMFTQGGKAASADAKAAGRKAGHSDSAVKRARDRLKIHSDSSGFPRITIWYTDVAWNERQSAVRSLSLGSDPTELTEPTEPTGTSQSGQSVQLVQLDHTGETVNQLGFPADDKTLSALIHGNSGTAHDDEAVAS